MVLVHSINQNHSASLIPVTLLAGAHKRAEMIQLHATIPQRLQGFHLAPPGRLRRPPCPPAAAPPPQARFHAEDGIGVDPAEKLEGEAGHGVLGKVPLDEDAAGDVGAVADVTARAEILAEVLAVLVALEETCNVRTASVEEGMVLKALYERRK